jgi:hypothetical protein
VYHVGAASADGVVIQQARLVAMQTATSSLRLSRTAEAASDTRPSIENLEKRLNM